MITVASGWSPSLPLKLFFCHYTCWIIYSHVIDATIVLSPLNNQPFRLNDCSEILQINKCNFVLSDLGLDSLVRHDGSWFAHHHPSPNILSLQSTDQSAQVISCFCPIQRFMEHLNTWGKTGRTARWNSCVYTNTHTVLHNFEHIRIRLVFSSIFRAVTHHLRM